MRTLLLAAPVACAALAGCDDTLFGLEYADVSDDSETQAGAPTWYQDVRPIIADRCWRCHSEEVANPAEGVPPFEDYEDVAPLASWIATKLQGDDLQPRYMPPFGARDTEECSPEGEWLDDWRLSDAQLETFLAWLDAGTPEGAPESAAPAEMPEIVTLEGPGIESYTLPETQVPPGDDLYFCFSLELGLEQTRWIDGMEIFPDNRDVVHHVVVFTDPLAAAPTEPYPCYGGPEVPESQVIFAWAPGGQPMTMPPDSGVEMQPGGRLIAQMHYHPGDETSVDASRVAVRWIDEQPTWLARMEVYGALAEHQANSSNLEDGEFLVPAGVTGHVETWRQPLALDGEKRIWAVFPHMHELGQDELITLSGDRGERCLSHNDRWDFNWQLAYRYAGAYEDLPIVDASDELIIRCTYDNDTERDVHIGEDTVDEMCLAIVGMLEESGGASAARARMVHLVEGGPAVDVYVEDTLAAAGLSAGEGTPYAELPPGSYTVTLSPAGGGLDDPQAVSFGPLAFNSELPTTLVAYGAAPDIAGAALVDSDANIAAEDIRVQLFHAAPSWPSLDVLSASGDALLNELDLGEARLVPDQPAGAYTIGVDVNGDGAADARFALPSIAGGSFVNLYLAEAGGTPAMVLHYEDGSTAWVTPE